MPMMSLNNLQLLGRYAKELEWASPSQMLFENLFFDLLEWDRPSMFGPDSDFKHWCLKASTPEMIDEAIFLATRPVKVRLKLFEPGKEVLAVLTPTNWNFDGPLWVKYQYIPFHEICDEL